MRLLFGCLAVLLGIASISLAARYGYKGADTEIDGMISAVVLGAIALCAFLFDAAAVRLWFQRHRVGAVVIGFIAALALIVTFTNSLGAIAGRADITQAERERTKTLGKGDERDLERLVRERGAMQFTTVDQATVDAAREAATTAERIRERECGNGDPKQRGPNCRLRESEEQAKRDALTAALANRAATERAASLDRDTAKLRTRLEKALPVSNPNPLGAALEQILGQAAAALTAWQQAIVAAVFELCLVGVMVIYELLGHAKPPVQQRVGEARSQKALGGGAEITITPLQKITVSASPARRKAVPPNSKTNGSVKSFMREQVSPADGERVEIKALMNDYRAWCAQKNLAPMDLNEFLDEIETLCRKDGIEIEVGDDQRVYCLNVRLGTVASAAALH